MLPCGVREASHASYFAPIYHFLLRKKKKMNAPAGNQTRVSSVAGTYTITVLPALILMSAQLVSTQSDNLVILQDSQCRNAMSAECPGPESRHRRPEESSAPRTSSQVRQPAVSVQSPSQGLHHSDGRQSPV